MKSRDEITREKLTDALGGRFICMALDSDDNIAYWSQGFRRHEILGLLNIAHSDILGMIKPVRKANKVKEEKMRREGTLSDEEFQEILEAIELPNQPQHATCDECGASDDDEPLKILKGRLYCINCHPETTEEFYRTE